LNLKFLLLIFSVFSFPFLSVGQEATSDTEEEELSSIEISGSIDGYYRLGSLQSPSQTAIVLEHNKPALGSFNLAVNYDTQNYGGLLHFAAGPRAEQSYNLDDNNVLRYIRQSYIYYKPIDKLKLWAGTAGALPGYENDEPHLNPTYSTSFLNSLIPGIHTGLWLDYEITDQLAFNIGVYNDMDRRIDVTPGKHLGSMISYENDNHTISISYVMGKEGEQDLKIIDMLWDYQIDQKNAVALELLYNSYKSADLPVEDFYGFGAYYIHDISDDLSLNMRCEYMKDNAGFSFDVQDVSVWDLTLTAKYQIGDFLFMPELRYDRANKPSFLDKDNNINAENIYFLLGLIYYIGEVR